MKPKDAEAQIHELAKDETNIKFAPQTLADEYQAEIDEFLAACFGVHGAWVSDWSECSDFGKSPKGDWRRIAAQKFGIDTPGRDPLVVDVARLIRAKRLQ